jgi:hypothetical protein
MSLAQAPRQRIVTMSMTSGDGLSGGILVDPVTMRPLGRTRIRVVRVPEALASAARGP